MADFHKELEDEETLFVEYALKKEELRQKIEIDKRRIKRQRQKRIEKNRIGMERQERIEMERQQRIEM